MRKLAFGFVGVAIVIGPLIAGWAVGESHYRNCLDAVALRYPANAEGNGKRFEPSENKYGQYSGAGEKPRFSGEQQTGGTGAYEAKRDKAVASCSRWP